MRAGGGRPDGRDAPHGGEEDTGASVDLGGSLLVLDLRLDVVNGVVGLHHQSDSLAG